MNLMRRRAIVLLGIFLFLACSIGGTEGSYQDDDDDDDDEKHPSHENKDAARTTDISNDYDDERLIVENPHYVNPNVKNRKRAENEEEENEENDVEYESKKNVTKAKLRKRETKSALDKALREGNPFSPSVRRRVFNLMRKHRIKLMLGLTLLAFRREVLYGLKYAALAMTKKTGKTAVPASTHNPAMGTNTTSTWAVPSTIAMSRFKYLLLAATIAQVALVFMDNGSGNSEIKALIPFLLPVALLWILTSSGSLGQFVIVLLRVLLGSFESAADLVPIDQHYSFERINERYNRDSKALRQALKASVSQKSSVLERINVSDFVSLVKAARSSLSSSSSSPSSKQLTLPSSNETVVILDLSNLDSSVSQLDTIRDEVSFLLSEYRHGNLHQPSNTATVAEGSNATESVNDDEKKTEKKTPVGLEIIVLIESSGGRAAEYALASQQILRLRNEGIQVTVCVDKVAASGGYMMACTSSPGRLFAAPFAVLGSIGVYGELVNIHKVLEGWGVQPLTFRAGRNKAPVGVISKVTEEGMANMQQMLDRTHVAFRKHVADARPVTADRMDELATGDVWLGYDALEMGLVDRLLTSDEYISERVRDGARVLKLVQVRQRETRFSKHSAEQSSFQKRKQFMGIVNASLLFVPLFGWLGQIWSNCVNILQQVIAAGDWAAIFNSLGEHAVPMPTAG